MSRYAGGTPQGSTRRVVVWVAATAIVLVLLLGYRTSTGGSVRGGGALPPGIVGGAPGVVEPSPQPGASGRTNSGTAPGGSGGHAVLVNGDVAQTRWGPVQVQVAITGHRITDVKALIYPSGNGHDDAINSYALPQLRQEVLVAQSAQIDAVSGATVTSDGYRESLQAALDAAHFTG